MPRHKDLDWNTHSSGNLDEVYYQTAQLAVLMDIRDDLKELNRTLGCHNVVGGMVALQQLNKRAAKHWPLTKKVTK